MGIYYYVKWVNGRLYPKKARFGDYAYAISSQWTGKTSVTKHLGIRRVPRAALEKNMAHVESKVEQTPRRLTPLELGYDLLYVCRGCGTPVGEEDLEVHRRNCKLNLVVKVAGIPDELLVEEHIFTA